MRCGKSTKQYDKILSCITLLVITLSQDFLENFTCAAGVAHFMVCLGQIEFGLDFLPLFAFVFGCRTG